MCYKYSSQGRPGAHQKNRYHGGFDESIYPRRLRTERQTLCGVHYLYSGRLSYLLEPRKKDDDIPGQHWAAECCRWCGFSRSTTNVVADGSFWDDDRRCQIEQHIREIWSGTWKSGAQHVCRPCARYTMRWNKSLCASETPCWRLQADPSSDRGIQ